MKGRGERERYTQLNAEFQRIAKRDKKAFFNEHAKKQTHIEQTIGYWREREGGGANRSRGVRD